MQTEPISKITNEKKDKALLWNPAQVLASSNQSKSILMKKWLAYNLSVAIYLLQVAFLTQNSTPVIMVVVGYFGYIST